MIDPAAKVSEQVNRKCPPRNINIFSDSCTVCNNAVTATVVAVYLICQYYLNANVMWISCECYVNVMWSSIFTWQMYNALYIIRNLCKYFVENLTEDVVVEQFRVIDVDTNVGMCFQSSTWQRCGVVVSTLASINEVNRHWDWLLLGWVTACGRVSHFGM